MGHYDTCREENCGACGQAKGVIWGCGREGCTSFHQHLRNTGQHERLAEILAKQKAQRELEEEERVVARQIARHTKKIASQAKLEAEGQ